MRQSYASGVRPWEGEAQHPVGKASHIPLDALKYLAEIKGSAPPQPGVDHPKTDEEIFHYYLDNTHMFREHYGIGTVDTFRGRLFCIRELSKLQDLGECNEKTWLRSWVKAKKSLEQWDSRIVIGSPATPAPLKDAN